MVQNIFSFFQFVSTRKQTTLRYSVNAEGKALFSGQWVRFELHPAPAHFGIVFERADLTPKCSIPAKASAVLETPRSTILGSEGSSVRLVEHLLAALWIRGIDNARILIYGNEVPIFDGSSAPFLSLLDRAEKRELSEEKRVYRLLQEVSIELPTCSIRATPAEKLSFSYHLRYSGQEGILRAQSFEWSRDLKEQEISLARTFCSYEEIQPLIASGAIQSVDLEHAVVVQGGQVINPGGLRYENEMARHKIIDMIGDLALVPFCLIARFEGFFSGHSQTTALAKVLEKKGIEEAIDREF